MSVKILHTADWHIGKKLHEYNLSEDHIFFMDWIIELIKEKDIDYLMISGDVFDLANPSQESLRIYYQFLAKLSGTGCKAIVTAGNHDSPALIDAPSELLHALQIKVVGTIPESFEDCLVPISDKAGNITAAVAAIPFLRDRDIRNAVEGESYEDRVEAVRTGIGNFYKKAAGALEDKFPKAIHMAMGHLYVQGSALSDSEREIQIGNLAGVDESTFPESLRYVALGHIHKSQNVGSDRVRYSGSPIPLSFSEKNYGHKVILLHIEDGVVRQEDIRVKKFRKLQTVTGNFSEVKNQALNLENDCILPVLLDLNIIEEVYNPQMSELLEELSKELQKEGKKEIVHLRIKYQSSPVTAINHETLHLKREEMSPEKIFGELIAKREKEEQNVLMQLFFELKQEAEESESK